MAKLSTRKDYTAAMTRVVAEALSEVNEDGSRASAAQISQWLDDQIRAKVLRKVAGQKAAEAKQGEIDRLASEGF